MDSPEHFRAASRLLARALRLSCRFDPTCCGAGRRDRMYVRLGRGTPADRRGDWNPRGNVCCWRRSRHRTVASIVFRLSRYSIHKIGEGHCLDLSWDRRTVLYYCTRDSKSLCVGADDVATCHTLSLIYLSAQKIALLGIESLKQSGCRLAPRVQNRLSVLRIKSCPPPPHICGTFCGYKIVRGIYISIFSSEKIRTVQK